MYGRRWLLKRARGISSLRDTGLDENDCVDAPRHHQIVVGVLPQLSGLLSGGADVHLDLRWGEAHVWELT